jgi:RNA polymerase II subunit A small phosphatase-like protein
LNMMKLLILDLDETLIHTTYSPIPDLEYVSQKGYYYLYERPFLKDFLVQYSETYALAIWSASKADYVRWILNSTVLKDFEFEFVHTRRHCRYRIGKFGTPEYLKDLNSLGGVYEKVCMLDDTPKMVTPIDCCIKVPEFKGSANDAFLKTVTLL